MHLPACLHTYVFSYNWIKIPHTCRAFSFFFPLWSDCPCLCTQAVVFVSLGVITCLIWFTMRISRKFKFDNRDLGSGAAEEYDGDEGSKDDGDSDGLSPTEQKIQIALLVVPTIAVITSAVIILTADTNHEADSASCGSIAAHATFVNIKDSAGDLLMDGEHHTFIAHRYCFRGTCPCRGFRPACLVNLHGWWMDVGAVKFVQKKPADATAVAPNIEVDATFTHTKSPISPYKYFFVNEFPVPESGDCSQLGGPYPAGAGYIKFAPQLKVTSAASDPKPYNTQYAIDDTEAYQSVATANKQTLFGLTSIVGRSVKICKTATCAPNEVCHSLFVSISLYSVSTASWRIVHVL
jgi:hypothetical protein